MRHPVGLREPRGAEVMPGQHAFQATRLFACDLLEDFDQPVDFALAVGEPEADAYQAGEQSLGGAREQRQTGAGQAVLDPADAEQLLDEHVHAEASAARGDAAVFRQQLRQPVVGNPFELEADHAALVGSWRSSPCSRQGVAKMTT